MTTVQHVDDILVRTGKTILEVYGAVLSTGLLGVSHLSASAQAVIVGGAGVATIVVNVAVKVRGHLTNNLGHDLEVVAKALETEKTAPVAPVATPPAKTSTPNPGV